MDGKKYDQEKLRFDLLPWAEIEDIVKVLTLGAAKYDEDNWKKVANGKRRYFAAAHRHLAAHESGELNDSETGLPHLAHATCCLLFLAWIDKQEGYAEKRHCSTCHFHAPHRPRGCIACTRQPQDCWSAQATSLPKWESKHKQGETHE